MIYLVLLHNIVDCLKTVTTTLKNDLLSIRFRNFFVFNDESHIYVLTSDMKYYRSIVELREIKTIRHEIKFVTIKECRTGLRFLKDKVIISHILIHSKK